APDEQTAKQLLRRQQAHERSLIKLVREEARRTFGVSLSSLLHFISDHLLTESERHLQDVLFSYQDPETDAIPFINALPIANIQKALPPVALPAKESPSPADTISFLTHMAEAALVRTDVLSELDRLLMQLNHSYTVLKHAW